MTNLRNHEEERNMKRKWIWIAPLALLGIVLFGYLGGEIVMLLWNWLLPPLFGWRTLTFWQGLGLLALCRILFGGWGGSGGGKGHIRHRMRERMAERYGGTHARAVGKDDARGTRKIPPRASWLLGRSATAGF